jgi:hypothetical protein
MIRTLQTNKKQKYFSNQNIVSFFGFSLTGVVSSARLSYV